MRLTAILVMIPCLTASVVRAERPTPNFAGAEGFGAAARGGNGGREWRVTTLEDDVDRPPRGSLRWAVGQHGPRIVRFDVAGTIRLDGPLEVDEPYLTIDGSDAPGDGICLSDHSFVVRDCHDVVVRFVRFRRGDVTTLALNRRKKRERPTGSGDLDCVELRDAQSLLFDHCSLSWSNDELFGITRCRDVTIQWCLLAEPLSNPALHPYGDNHAYGINSSAATLSIHHCLFARFVMRGPQFEANDVRPSTDYDPKFEVVNNVVFDYQRSGSRYTTGIEDRPEDAVGRTFAMQFINNFYVNDQPRPEILATTKHGVIEPLRVFVSGNLGPNRPSLDDDEWRVLFAEQTPMREADADVQAQVARERLFKAPIPVTEQSAAEAYDAVLREAGCSLRRDAADRRIVEDVQKRRFREPVRSQVDVGGWPELQ